MPVQLTTIDTTDIIAELRRRGYGIDNKQGFAFRVSRPSKTAIRRDGTANYEPIGGVTVRQLRQIATTSRDAAHAADRIESLANGVTQTVEETDETRNGPSLAGILHAIDNRIEEKLEPVTSALNQLVDIVKGMMATRTEGKPRQPRKPRQPVPSLVNKLRGEFDDFTEEELAAIEPPPPAPRRRSKKAQEVEVAPEPAQEVAEAPAVPADDTPLALPAE